MCIFARSDFQPLGRATGRCGWSAAHATGRIAGMTRKLSVSVPDDIAEFLEAQDNTSAFVADAVRARMRAEKSWAALRAGGYIPTEESRARGQARLAAGKAGVTPESIAASLEALGRASRTDAA